MTTGAPAKTPDLMLLFSLASHVLESELAARLGEVGLIPREQCVLQHALQGEFSQKELADMCDLDKTTMVVTMDHLEKAGLAKRQPSSTDRRAHVIVVTPDGEKAVAEGQRVVDDIYNDVLSTLPDTERDALLAGLARLVKGRLSTPVECERPVRRRAPRAA